MLEFSLPKFSPHFTGAINKKTFIIWKNKQLKGQKKEINYFSPLPVYLSSLLQGYHVKGKEAGDAFTHCWVISLAADSRVFHLLLL